MKGAGVTITMMITAIWFFSVPFSAHAQEGRGPAGLPAYLKSPSDRPPPTAIEPAIVASKQSTDELLATIPPKDSVIVIRGKVNMGGRNYFSVYPIFRAGSLYGAMKACRKDFLMKPQYQAAEQEGYTMIVVVKDTATNPVCWNEYRYLETVDLSCDQLMVKTAEQGESVAWDNPDSSYANSYDLRTFNLGPVLSR
ncbi:MAG: hypothetical protein OEM47_00320 [Deltaproteobacteria bacterium]|nr:hypothetical protein [Deltaproteobacteria bacterium]